jgi:tetratricopeptide (TPR) repeat protein
METTENVGWENYLEAAHKARHLARYADAEKLYEKALAEAEKVMREGVAEAAQLKVHLGLGDLYLSQSSFVQAENSFRRAAALSEKALSKNADVTMAVISDKLGRVYRAQGKFSEVEAYFKRALLLF